MTWAYITAFDPGEERLLPSENERRQNKLERKAKQLGHVIPGIGAGDDRSAPRPQRSVLILGITETKAAELGSFWRQDAILVGHRGRRARLKLLQPTR